MKKRKKTRPEDAKPIWVMGGEAVRDKYGSDYYRRLQKLGVEAKKRKKKAGENSALDSKPRG